VNKKRLWIISELFYPEQTSTGYFLTEIAKGLAPDMDVHVLCGQPSYSERGMRVPHFEQWQGLTIYRLKSTHFDKDRLVLRAINLITFTMACIFKLMASLAKGDQLVIVTNPPSLIPMIAMLARLWKVRSILLVHDVYPDILAATGMLSRHSLPYRIVDRLMGSSFRQFAKIVVLGRDMQMLIHNKTARELADVPIISNWADHEEIVPMQRLHNPFSVQHGLLEKVVIQFSGNIGRTHDIESILKVAKATRQDDRLIFVFIGYGGKAGGLVDRIAADGLQNVVFLPRQPREMLGPMLASATAVVIAFEANMVGLSVPSRMYNVMAAGTPIIAMADATSELAMTVDENRAGWIVPQGSSEMLEDLVRFLCTDEGAAEANRRGIAARNAAVTRFDFGSVINHYRALLIERIEPALVSEPISRPEAKIKGCINQKQYEATPK
jgi:colanic acid biosynthesis glycosyl transferase WcaI